MVGWCCDGHWVVVGCCCGEDRGRGLVFAVDGRRRGLRVVVLMYKGCCGSCHGGMVVVEMVDVVVWAFGSLVNGCVVDVITGSSKSSADPSDSVSFVGIVVIMVPGGSAECFVTILSVIISDSVLPVVVVCTEFTNVAVDDTAGRFVEVMCNSSSDIFNDGLCSESLSEVRSALSVTVMVVGGRINGRLVVVMT